MELQSSQKYNIHASVCVTGANKCLTRTKVKAAINTGISEMAKCPLPSPATFRRPSAPFLQHI